MHCEYFTANCLGCMRSGANGLGSLAPYIGVTSLPGILVEPNLSAEVNSHSPYYVWDSNTDSNIG